MRKVNEELLRNCVILLFEYFKNFKEHNNAGRPIDQFIIDSCECEAGEGIYGFPRREFSIYKQVIGKNDPKEKHQLQVTMSVRIDASVVPYIPPEEAL